jgi:predicted regulator of Ras-like GTPase activity (Roadblock/LC7/MglB family)
MLGLFKKMLSKSESVPATPFAKATPAAPTPASKQTDAAPRVNPVPVRALPATPRPVSPLPRPAVAHVPARLPAGASSHVQVALAAIASALPESISHKVPASPEQFVSIPVDKVLPQLAHGMVIMTVAELLECSAESFAALSGNDDLQVTLPLGDIVKQLSPEHFTRRAQKRVEIPEEVSSVFAAGTSGVTISKAVPVAPGSRLQPTGTAPVVAKSSAPAPAPIPAASNPPAKISMSAQAMAALGAKPTAVPTVEPTSQKRTVQPAEIPVPSRATNPPTAQPRIAQPAPAGKKPTFGTPKISGDLTVPLGFVCNDWADEVRAQLSGVVVAEAQIQVPLELLQPAMQSGRVLFSWQQVASWIRPALQIPPTQKVGEMAVEFPLKVVAPLFMAHHRAATQKRVAVDSSIPDLFGGGANEGAQAQVTQPSPSSGATKKEFAPAVVPRREATLPVSPAPVAKTSGSPIASPRPAPAQPPPKDSVPLEQVIGEAGKRLSAKEIVANTAKLPGVTGVLLAMSDGLLVTSQTSAQVRAETIAAFLPQMFGRMNQYTKELTLGPLQQLTLGVESGQWSVFKGETIYFAVQSKSGESLPLNLLAQIAAELSSQSK